MGMGELVGKSVEEYVGIAVGLGRDLGRLAQIRKGLRERMRPSALMDAVGFVRGLEEAYREMWRSYTGSLAGL